MRKRHSIVIGQKRGIIFLPDENMHVALNPMERTLYRLFLAHPEGIASDSLLAHWQELRDIYEQESCFDDQPLRDNALESLCSESKTVFYTTVSRIKRKFVDILGGRKASPYIIKRCKDGDYRIRATLGQRTSSSSNAASTPMTSTSGSAGALVSIGANTSRWGTTPSPARPPQIR